MKGKERFQEIKVSLIDTEGQSVREMIESDHVVELAMSIAKHGLLEPIVVRRKNENKYQLLAGLHRLCAFVRLKKETIPANVIENEETPTKAIALVENIVRKDMSLDEEVKAIEYLYKEEKLSPSQICDLIGKSREWVDKRLWVPNLPEDIKQELLDGRISIKHAEVLSKIEDKSARAYILNAAIQQKLTARQTDDLARVYLDTPSIPDAIEKGLEEAQKIQAAKLYKECTLCREKRLIDDIVYIPVCRGGCQVNENTES